MPREIPPSQQSLPPDEPEFERKFRKIAETSEEYAEEREIYRQVVNQPDWAVFGAAAVLASKPFPLLHSMPEEEKRRTETRRRAYLKRKLDQCRWDIASAAENAKSEIIAREFFREMLGDAAIAKQLKKLKLPKRPNMQKFREELLLIQIFEKSMGVEKELELLYPLRLAMNISAVSDELLLEMLTLHEARFREREAQLEEKLPHLRRKFQESLETAIANNVLPLSYEIAAQRLSTVSVFIQDAITANLHEVYGQYNPDMNRVLIAEQVPDSKLDEVYAHEMVHALGGKTILGTAYREAGEEGFGKYDIGHMKHGIRFKGKKPIFGWLDEALTESISKKITGTKNHSIYGFERKLLNLLMERGARPIPEKLFFGAYFESYDPNQPIEERIPAWKALTAEINTAYEPGFLPALDRYVRKHGVKAAFQTMEQDWRKIKDRAE